MLVEAAAIHVVFHYTSRYHQSSVQALFIPSPGGDGELFHVRLAEEGRRRRRGRGRGRGETSQRLRGGAELVMEEEEEEEEYEEGRDGGRCDVCVHIESKKGFSEP
jgi:hypothetical protein